MRQPRQGEGAEPEAGSALENARFDGQSNTKTTRIDDSAQAVYDGRNIIGWLRVRHDGRAEVFKANGESLGLFNKRASGLVALFEHCQRATA